jgi:hypothetical protein
MTPSGIDPTTFLFVSQCLNHCATAYLDISSLKISTPYNRRHTIPPTVYGTFTGDYEIKGFLLLKCSMLHLQAVLVGV